jgi:RNA-directed DNA polymerase
MFTRRRRTFLGYSLTWHREPKLRIAGSSQQLLQKVRALLRGAQGRSLVATIHTLTSVLRRWAANFRLAATKRVLEERDGCLP